MYVEDALMLRLLSRDLSRMVPKFVQLVRSSHHESYIDKLIVKYSKDLHISDGTYIGKFGWGNFEEYGTYFVGVLHGVSISVNYTLTAAEFHYYHAGVIVMSGDIIDNVIIVRRYPSLITVSSVLTPTDDESDAASTTSSIDNLSRSIDRMRNSFMG